VEKEKAILVAKATRECMKLKRTQAKMCTALDPRTVCGRIVLRRPYRTRWLRLPNNPMKLPVAFSARSLLANRWAGEAHCVLLTTGLYYGYEDSRIRT